MPVAFYMDVHIPAPITAQLRRRGVDVLTAIEDGRDTSPDEDILDHARGLGRVVFTHDIGFRAMAEDWQRQNRPFAGLIFGHQLGGTIGQFVRDLELIAKATEPDEWLNKIEYLPY